MTTVPAITDHSALAEWLEKHDARYLWTAMGDAALAQGWRVNGHLCLVVLYLNVEHGWDLFTSPQTTIISDTLEDASKRLGIP